MWEAESESEGGRARARYCTSSWMVLAEAVALLMSNEDIIGIPQRLDVALGKCLVARRCYRPLLKASLMTTIWAMDPYA